MKPYSAIIFDFGGVILNIDFQKSIDSFKHKIPGFQDRDYNGKPNQNEIFSRYEVGATDTDTFYEEFLEHYQTSLSFESFAESWNAMLLNLPGERMERIDSLRKRGTRVFLLSNINALHAERAEQIYEDLRMGGSFRQHFERGYYSFEMGLRKPDPRIFLRVLEENNLNASETLFIDDGEQHIESAKKLGIQTIHLFNMESIDKLSL
jgi:epoxide hydrolase-like predicted phosphatase